MAGKSGDTTDWGEDETLWLLVALIVVLVPFLGAALFYAAKENSKYKLMKLGFNPSGPDLATPATDLTGAARHSKNKSPEPTYEVGPVGGIQAANWPPASPATHYHPQSF